MCEQTRQKQKLQTIQTKPKYKLPNHTSSGKLYASSAFFTPGLHPTVEDQVELARRISSSLSDANNKLSKGQTMYVNRKKRSVKWVHEGEGICFNLICHTHTQKTRTKPRHIQTKIQKKNDIEANIII